MLHALLWQENADLVRECRDHPFVRGLYEGTLPLDAFRRYVGQDAFFLRAFVQAYAVALARCDRLAYVRQLHTFVGGALEELKLHAAYAAELGLDLDEITPWPTTLAYTDFLRRTAWHEELGRTLAAMTPCMRLYAHLGQAGGAYRHAQHPYVRWLDTYAAPEFDALARQVETLLDALATDTPAVHDAYRYALLCEREFFSAPLEPAA